ncbi:hypothetical protein FF38_00596, partial [Lucilia cuprina]
QATQHLEEEKLKANELATQVTHLRGQVDKDRSSYLLKIEDRDDFLENLHDQMTDLKTELTKQTNRVKFLESQMDKPEDLSMISSVDTSLEEYDFFSEPEIKIENENNETLTKAKYMSQLRSLNAQNKKLRLENLHLKKQKTSANTSSRSDNSGIDSGLNTPDLADTDL